MHFLTLIMFIKQEQQSLTLMKGIKEIVEITIFLSKHKKPFHEIIRLGHHFSGCLGSTV